MKLLCIRHAKNGGDPYAKPERPVKGALGEEGIRQAEALCEALSGVPIDHVACSSYGRAIQTAEIALAGRSVLIEILDGLREWTPTMEYRNLTSTEHETIGRQLQDMPPEMEWGSPIGEGAYEVYARVVPTLLGYLDEQGVHPRHGGYVIDEEARDKTLAIFAHGGSLNVAMCHLLRVPPFPVGTFCLGLTGVAEIDFCEKAGVWYPQLVVGWPRRDSRPE